MDAGLAVAVSKVGCRWCWCFGCFGKALGHSGGDREIMGCSGVFVVRTMSNKVE